MVICQAISNNTLEKLGETLYHESMNNLFDFQVAVASWSLKMAWQNEGTGGEG